MSLCLFMTFLVAYYQTLCIRGCSIYYNIYIYISNRAGSGDCPVAQEPAQLAAPSGLLATVQ